MLGALLTALFFGVTPVCANRAIRLLGFASANFWRLLTALAALGIWAFTFGQGLQGAFWWFFTAGAIGFGLGGMCMFLALPRLGAPLASLMVESLAAVTAAGLAWIWYGDAIEPSRFAWIAMTLTGVGIGLMPYIRGRGRPSGIQAGGQAGVRAGALWAVLAGAGQAVSIVISRKALISMKLAGASPDLLTAAFQRLLGGFVVALAVWGLFGLLGERPFARASGDLGPSARPWLWVVLNALFGPILGVTCLIWALKTMQPGLAQTIAATAPLISIPFSRWLEGHSPPPLFYFGCLWAIAGLGGIYLTR